MEMLRFPTCGSGPGAAPQVGLNCSKSNWSNSGIVLEIKELFKFLEI